MTLDDDDRALVDEARADLGDERLPANRGPLGCLVALVGMGAMAVWPSATQALPALSFFTPFVLLGGVVAVLGGLGSSLFGGQGARSMARAATEAALRTLEDPEAGREERLRAATVLVTRARISTGPSTEEVLDLAETRGRLVDDTMALVLAVERYLVQERGALPVFEQRSL